MCLLVILVVALPIALSLIVSQALGAFEFKIIRKLLGLFELGEILRYLGITWGGVVLTLQAVIANKRARAMYETAKAQAAAAKEQATANRNTEKGQRQERLRNAIEHLGNQSESVRLGGAYELFHLAHDTESLRKTVLDILCSHVRRTTREDEYRKHHASQPSEEIQSLLTLLFVQEHDVFSGLRINLNESFLNGANLCEARLRGADLRRASLNEVLLHDAHLEGVNLSEAHLKEARLMGACLREACLIEVSMQGANLVGAQLQGADILAGNLTAAYLRGAYLQGADLAHAQMFGATLSSVRAQGARLSWTYLQGAFLDEANLQGAGQHHWEASSPFCDRVLVSVGKASDVSGVKDGALTATRVLDLVDEVLSAEKKQALELRLEPYIDKPSRRELPEKHGSVLGSYTDEEARIWITEHETAMASVAST